MKSWLRISVGLNVIFAIYILMKASRLFALDFLPEPNIQEQTVETEQTETALAAASQDRINCNTLYTVHEYDLSTGREKIYQETLPASFIGMTRAQLLTWVDERAMHTTLEDKEQGLVAMELLSFSEKEIRIRKRIESVPAELAEEEIKEPGKIYVSGAGESSVSENSTSCYGCILAQDGLLTVYDEQKRHVILYTDIPLFDLPQDQQQEILEGKIIRTEEELYHLLESYSS